MLLFIQVVVVELVNVYWCTLWCPRCYCYYSMSLWSLVLVEPIVVVVVVIVDHSCFSCC